MWTWPRLAFMSPSIQTPPTFSASEGRKSLDFHCWSERRASRVHQLVMRIPVAELRVRGVMVVFYLDDLLVIAQSRAEALQHTTFTVFNC